MIVVFGNLVLVHTAYDVTQKYNFPNAFTYEFYGI